MEILLVSATQSEILPALTHFNINGDGCVINSLSVTALITGVGMVATAYALGNILSRHNFDLAINAGIAGSFDRSLKIGEQVSVKFDCFAELGAEDGDDFISIDNLGFGKSSVKPKILFEHDAISLIQKVSAITVNKVHGQPESIYSTTTRLNPQIESMEGAAFFYACNQADLPCLQLRTISNYVERRDRENWNIPLAVQNLNNTLIKLLTELV